MPADATDQVSIRPLSEEDAPRFLDLRLQLDGEMEFMMLEPGERDRSAEAAQNDVQEGVRRHSMRVWGQFVDEWSMAKLL